MPSNALSQKSFSTKTPLICKPPPWPPFVPPPPLPTTRFYVFASIDDRDPVSPLKLAGSFHLYPIGPPYYWEGSITKDPWKYNIIGQLTLYPITETYSIKITYKPPGVSAKMRWWRGQTWTTPRPYVGAKLFFYEPAIPRNDTCITREIPA